MNIGLNVTDNIQFSIGQTFEDIKEYLEESKIEYSIPFDTGKKGSDDKVIIIYVDKHGIELGITGKRIVYMKTTNYKANILVRFNKEKQEDGEELELNKVELLNNVIDSVAKEYKISRQEVRVESYDTTTLNIILRVKNEVRISLYCNGDTIYIHTIRKI